MIPRQFLISAAILLTVAIGMAAYVWHLRGREALSPRPARLTQHVGPPPSGPTEKVTVWVAYDSPGDLRPQSISIPLAAGRQQRAEQLIRGLVDIYVEKNSPHPLGSGAEVRGVFLVDPGLAVIDLNAAFADGHTSGLLAEDLTLASVVQTLSANVPGLMRVKILVDGKERETLAGHADLSGFYDVAQVSELAKQLVAQ
jgi:prepilin-type processing-associated H-X9-DG protein